MLLCKKVPYLRNLRMVCFVTYRNIPGYSCQRSAFVTITVKYNLFLCRKGKALCEYPDALHRQQPEKDKQNIDVAAPGKISADAHGKGVWVHSDESSPITAVRNTAERSFSKLRLNQNVSQINYNWWKAIKSANDIYWKFKLLKY